VLIRGRRRVGKSRLVEEFLRTADVSSVFFTASRKPDRQLARFAAEISESNLPDAHLYAATPQTWDAALALLANVLPDQPSIVVIDELPYLLETDPGLEAILQNCWDRHLKKKPVLLLLVGSDLARMEALDQYGRAFHRRGTELVVPPFSPAEIATMVDLAAADAIDAFLVTGGLPLVLDEWPAGTSLNDYLRDALARSTSALIVSAERALAAEFPAEGQARRVLGAVGSARTFSTIQRVAGGLTATSLNRSLDLLTSKRVIARDVPLSEKPSKEARYRIADPYQRFWLRFIGPHLSEIERGRSDLVLARIEQNWTKWRDQAVEPVVREALERLLPDERFPDAEKVGGFWTRTNDITIDLVGADRSPVARRTAFVGSIKWREGAPFDQSDVAVLTAHSSQLPGASDSTLLVGVSRSDFSATGLDAQFTPADLLSALG
jgi:uncharacterized protein